MKAAAHYKDARYFAVIPIELMLRIILYSGYVMALLVALYHGTVKFAKHFFLGVKAKQTNLALTTSQEPSLV